MQKGTNTINIDVSHSNKVFETVNDVFSFENLYKSFEKCTLAVSWKYSTQHYMLNACFRIARLRKRILNNEYKMSQVREFVISERGKTRKISALTFEDRIVQKCLCEYYLNDLFSKSFIYDSGATLKGKGLGFTRKRILTHLRRYYRHYGNNGYILKVDLHDYFASIDHDILKNKIKRKVKDSTLYKIIIDCIPSNLNGLGLGSQVSQICAMFYLNELDHFIKEKLRFKYYARYMDDLYILCNSKKRLKSALYKIRQIIKSHKLQINENKTRIQNLSRGFIFCKTRYFVTKTGKIVKLPTGHAFKRYNRKIKKGISVKEITYSFISYLKNFNAYKYLQIALKSV